VRTAGVLGSPTAWVFGNEARGLEDEHLALVDRAVSLPIYGQAESLNLATAASVCLYESAFAHRS
jgi:TrmH family RNA methyltransferase